MIKIGFKKIKYLVCVLLLGAIVLPLSGYCIIDIEDPFCPMLPEEKMEQDRTQVTEVEKERQEDVVEPPLIELQGVLWGTELPLALIEGEIYNVGDSVIGTNAKIHKIENNDVLILFEGELFRINIKNTNDYTKEEE
ncbi:MAG: hypothetical protein GY858_01660 [Candidatus Omnitrophica bacterium]|nr:hypothetical protein [Candidatus Omnitrophota bacterium]